MAAAAAAAAAEVVAIHVAASEALQSGTAAADIAMLERLYYALAAEAKLVRMGGGAELSCRSMHSLLSHRPTHPPPTHSPTHLCRVHICVRCKSGSCLSCRRPCRLHQSARPAVVAAARHP